MKIIICLTIIIITKYSFQLRIERKLDAAGDAYALATTYSAAAVVVNRVLKLQKWGSLKDSRNGSIL